MTTGDLLTCGHGEEGMANALRPAGAEVWCVYCQMWVSRDSSHGQMMEDLPGWSDDE